MYPNHTAQDALLIVGVYRPPNKGHPDSEEVYGQILHQQKENKVATIIMGDLNIHAWEEVESGEYPKWVHGEPRTDNV